MASNSVHEFHLIMDRKMKERLCNLNIFKKCRGLSDLIVKILKVMAPAVKKEHRWGEQRMGRYMKVCDDPDEVRENVHVYLPVELYRELKLIHQDLNAYSIAQLLREFLKWFLEFADGCKSDVFRELKKIFTQWAKEDQNSRLTPREYLRQLKKIIRHLPGRNRLVNIYNRDFSPLWILLL